MVKVPHVGGVSQRLIMFNMSLSADVKPEGDVDDWEAIATDEEKGELPHAELLHRSNV